MLIVKGRLSSETVSAPHEMTYLLRFDNHRVIVVVNRRENVNLHLWTILFGFLFVIDDQTTSVETFLNVVRITETRPEIVDQQKNGNTRGQERHDDNNQQRKARECPRHVLKEIQFEGVPIVDEHAVEFLRFQLQVLRLNFDVIRSRWRRSISQPQRMIGTHVEELVVGEVQLDQRVVANVVISNDDVRDKLCPGMIRIGSLRMIGREKMSNLVRIRPDEYWIVVIDIPRKTNRRQTRRGEHYWLDRDSNGRRSHRSHRGIVSSDDRQIVFILHFSVEHGFGADLARRVDGEEIEMTFQRVSNNVAVVSIGCFHLPETMPSEIGGVFIQGERVEVLFERRGILVLIENVHLHVSERFQGRLTGVSCANAELIHALEFIVEGDVARDDSLHRRDEEFLGGRTEGVDHSTVDSLIGIERFHLTDHARNLIVLQQLERVVRSEQRLLVVDIGDVQLKDHRTTQVRLTKITCPQFDLIRRCRLAIESTQDSDRIVIGTQDLQIEQTVGFDR